LLKKQRLSYDLRNDLRNDWRMRDAMNAVAAQVNGWRHVALPLWSAGFLAPAVLASWVCCAGTARDVVG
jgi:hypothetical protein